MSVGTKLCKDTNGKDVEQTLYQSMIGGLPYFTASHPDIAFSVGICVRFQACPKESHLTAVKRIIKYVYVGLSAMAYGIPSILMLTFLHFLMSIVPKMWKIEKSL